jgi:hypothetical protein
MHSSQFGGREIAQTYKLLPPTITLNQSCSKKSPFTTVITLKLSFDSHDYTFTVFLNTFQGISVTSINSVPAVKMFLVTEDFVKICFQQYMIIGRANGQVKFISLLSCPVHIPEINGQTGKRRGKHDS